MANIHVARSTAGDHFPSVARAVEQYRQANPGKEAGHLSRRLANEEILFRHFVEHLTLLTGSWAFGQQASVATNRGRSERQRLDRLNSDLQNIGEALLTLKAELNITSRGSEVLSKIKQKRTMLRKGQTQSSLQERLDDLSVLNRRLAAHLPDIETGLLPYIADYRGSLDYRITMEKGSNNSMEASNETTGIKIAGCRHICSAKMSAQEDREASNYSSSSQSEMYTPSTTDDSEVSDETEDRRFQHIAVASRSIKTLLGRPDSSMDDYWNQPSREGDQFEAVIPVTLQYSLGLNAPTVLQDLLNGCSANLDKQSRLEIAFHLSSAVIILAARGSKVQFSQWKQWSVAFEHEIQKDRLTICLVENPSATTDGTSGEADEGPAFAIMSRNSTLTLLGLRLAELALAQPLAKLRSADELLLPGVKTRNADVLDLLTVKRLLSQHRIEDEVGSLYESVVRICISQQYRVRKSGSIEQLDPDDDSFLESAAISILHPLHLEICKNLKCECYTSYLDDLKTASPEVQITPGSADRSHPVGGHSLPQPHSTSHRVQSFDLPGHQKESRHETTAHSAGPKSAATDSDVSESAPPAAQMSSNMKPRTVQNTGTPDDMPKWNQQRAMTNPSHSHLASKVLPLHDSSSHAAPTQGRYIRNPELHMQASESSLSYRIKDKDVEKGSIPEPMPNLTTPTAEDDAASESHESFTATTDSAFIWLSDDSDEPAPDSSNHPITALNDITVRILMRNFRTWRSRGTEATQAGRQSSRPAHSSSKKRKTGSVAMARSWTGQMERDEEDEEDENPDSEKPSSERHQHSDLLIFACPYFKRDPMSHGRCCSYTLRRIRDVKQHLTRRHRLPKYCPRCTKTFRNEELRDTHVRDADCERKPLRKPEGITDEQERKLRKKVPASQSPGEQWYGIFDILFPDHNPRPASAYLDGLLTQQVLEYQLFFRTQGPNIMHAIMSACGAVTWKQPPGEPDLDAFRRRVYDECIQAVFDGWQQSQSATGTAAKQHASTTSPQVSMTTGPSTAATNTTDDGASEGGQSLDAALRLAPEHPGFEPDMSAWSESSHWLSSLQINSPNAGMTGSFDSLTVAERQELSEPFMADMFLEQHFHTMGHQGGRSDTQGRNL